MILDTLLEELVRVVDSQIMTAIWMRGFEMHSASDLIMLALDQVAYLGDGAAWHTSTLQLCPQMFFVKVLEWTAMMHPGAWLHGNDLEARVCRVVCPLAFFSVAMPYVVGILLVEGVRWHDLGELRAPEGDGIFQAEADCLEKQPVLQSAKVFEVMCGTETTVEIPHAHWI